MRSEMPAPYSTELRELLSAAMNKRKVKPRSGSETIFRLGEDVQTVVETL